MENKEVQYVDSGLAGSAPCNIEEFFSDSPSVPDHLLDPIHQQLYRYPVILPTSGKTINYAVLRDCKFCDPFTRSPVKHVIANRDKSDEVDVYIDVQISELIDSLSSDPTNEIVRSRVLSMLPLLIKSDRSPCLNACRNIAKLLDEDFDRVAVSLIKSRAEFFVVYNFLMDVDGKSVVEKISYSPLLKGVIPTYEEMLAHEFQSVKIEKTKRRRDRAANPISVPVLNPFKHVEQQPTANSNSTVSTTTHEPSLEIRDHIARGLPVYILSRSTNRAIGCTGTFARRDTPMLLAGVRDGWARFTFTQDGFLKCEDSDFVLDINGGGTDGANIIIHPRKPHTNADNQRWMYNYANETMSSFVEDLVLDSTRGELRARKRQNSPNNENQRFYLLPASSATGTSVAVEPEEAGITATDVLGVVGTAVAGIAVVFGSMFAAQQLSRGHHSHKK